MFLKRLKLYGIGFVLGLGVVYALYGNRSCTTPNQIKMHELVFQTFEFSERAACKLHWMRKNEILLKLEMRHFEVNYDISNVHKKPCGEYFIQPKKEHKNEYHYTLLIHDCDTISKISDINLPPDTKCPCR